MKSILKFIFWAVIVVVVIVLALWATAKISGLGTITNLLNYIRAQF